MKRRWVLTEQTEIAENMIRLTMQTDEAMPAYEAGQFLHIRVTDHVDHLLRRPISLCLADPVERTITIVYRVGGKGTSLLAQKRAGDSLDVLGPLGHGFPQHEEDQHVLLVGGGIGVPPMVELAKQLTSKGLRVTSVLGFQSRTQAILIDELSEFGEVRVATNDGSLGQEGFVTGYFTGELLASVDRFYACGPTPMLAAVQTAMNGRVPGYLSLEERMGCGIGLCGGCVHQTVASDGTLGYRKVCKDGPVFAAQEVAF